MSVKEIIGGKLKDENDKFPLGMRVLVVDDDKICLKLLEKLLQKCQYQVTTTNEAKVALEMLRESRNRFDIIITDVQMPDMDGFKLLELVGLELDLPVIMLSVDSDPKLVMKGIIHGACDYLVKPVRLEELKIIWQHVIRKKKRKPEQLNKPSSQNKDQQGNGKSRNSDGSFDNSSKSFNKKRKDDDKQQQQEVEDDDDYDYGTDSDEPGTKKKRRVVWDTDLHNKFVTAVNQLGIGKGAVPKRILEHMNVEGLTRENVASHLQKYRLYLKRIHLMSPHTNIKDPYMRVNSIDQKFCNSALSLYQGGGVLNRLDTSSGGNFFSSSSLIQANNPTQNISNSFSTLSKFDSSKNTLYPGNINLITSSINNLHGAQKNILYSTQTEAIFSNQSSEPFNASLGPNNINNSAFSNFSSNHSLFSGALNRGTLVLNGSIENNSSLGGHILNNPLDSRRESLFCHFESANNVVPVNDMKSLFSHSFDQINGVSHRKMDIPLINVQNSDLSTSYQESGMCMEPKTKSDGDCFLEQWRSQYTGYDGLDGLLMNSMTKDQDGYLMMDGEFEIDAYTF